MLVLTPIRKFTASSPRRFSRHKRQSSVSMLSSPNRENNEVRMGFLTCLACAKASEFPPLFRWSDDFAGWQLDDADRNQLARLPAYRIGAASGTRRVRGTDTNIPSRPVRGRV